MGSGSAAFQRRQHRGRRLAAARRGRVARQELEAGAALRANGEGVQERVGVLGARVDLPRHQSLARRGECDDLVPHHLYSHMAKPRPGPKLPSCKGMPPVRYKSVAILKVARLIKDSGPEMRLLLKSDVPQEQVPTARETAALLEKQVEQLQEELKEQKEARSRAEAAARMAQHRRIVRFRG